MYLMTNSADTLQRQGLSGLSKTNINYMYIVYTVFVIICPFINCLDGFQLHSQVLDGKSHHHSGTSAKSSATVQPWLWPGHFFSIPFCFGGLFFCFFLLCFQRNQNLLIQLPLTSA